MDTDQVSQEILKHSIVNSNEFGSRHSMFNLSLPDYDALYRTLLSIDHEVNKLVPEVRAKLKIHIDQCIIAIVLSFNETKTRRQLFSVVFNYFKRLNKCCLTVVESSQIDLQLTELYQYLKDNCIVDLANIEPELHSWSLESLRLRWEAQESADAYSNYQILIKTVRYLAEFFAKVYSNREVVNV